jgi:ribonuclease D
LINLLKKISFKFKKKKDIYLIDSEDEKDFLIFYLEEENFLGIDTEFDWRTTYFPRLSLLQIATSNKIFLIDCIKCKNLNYLKKILENPKKLIIFHSSRSDTTVLNTNLNIKITNAFDIQVAEKNICGGNVKNYGTIVKSYFGIELDKSETNSNWLNRPFSEDQLSYAAGDVDFLIDIYRKQLKILNKRKDLNKAFEDSRKEAALGNEDLYVTRLKKLKKASKNEKDIFLWREKYASKKNIPPSHIFKDKYLKQLAKELSTSDPDEKNLFNIFKNNNSAEAFLNEMIK